MGASCLVATRAVDIRARSRRDGSDLNALGAELVVRGSDSPTFLRTQCQERGGACRWGNDESAGR